MTADSRLRSSSGAEVRDASGSQSGPDEGTPSSLSTVALAKGSLVVLFAQGLQSLRGVLLLPFITRMLSAGDYGLWVQAGTLTSLLSPIAALYLGNAILRFFAAEADARRVAGAFHGVMATVAALALAVTGAGLLGSGGIAAAFFEGESAVVSLSLASVLPECLASICLAYFRTFRQMGRFSFFSVALPYVELATLIVLLLTGHPLTHLIVAMAVVRAVIAAVMAGIILKETGWAAPDFSRLPQFLRFSLPLIPMNMLLWVTNASDRFVIGYYLGAAAVGYYNPGYALGSMVAFLSAPIMYVLPSFVYAHYDQGRPERAMRYLSDSISLVVIAGLLLTAVLGGLSLPVLSLLATGAIAQRSYLVTPFVALGVTAQVCTVVVSIALGCVKKTHLMAFSSLVGAALNLALNVIFIPRFGIVAAAATTLLAMLVDFAIRLRLAQQNVRPPVQWRRLAKAAVAAAALGSGLFLLAPSVGAASLCLAALVSPVAYLGMLLGVRVLTTSDLSQGWGFLMHLLRRNGV